jgi:putative holin Dp-1
MQLSNAWYNRIKWIITIGLPAVGAFYFGLAQLWDFPRISGVNGTINLIITFLGLLIGYSTKQYNKTENQPDGDLIVVESDGEKHLGLAVNTSVEAMQAKDTVTLTVVNKTSGK